MQQQRTGYVFHRTLVFFYFLLQIRRSLRLSVCAFYIRVEALYTLKHHPAESVTSDFFIADPSLDFLSSKSHVAEIVARHRSRLGQACVSVSLGNFTLT